jgi:hypothetical protein
MPPAKSGSYIEGMTGWGIESKKRFDGCEKSGGSGRILMLG